MAASSSSSSSSSQGSAPGVAGKRKLTPGDLIIYSLEDLNGSDFKRFRNKLSDFSYGDKRPIPRGRLENADWITTKDILIDTYGEEGALDVAIDVFTLIGLMGPANDLRERRAKHDKLKKMTHDNILSGFSKEHKESMKETFQRIPEYNSCMGEAVPLQKTFTKLLMRKGPQNKGEKEQEMRSSGRRHLQIMEKISSNKSSTTTIQALFDPDEDGFIPKIVVLQGAAGIGKTMTSKKIVLDWASGDLYQDKFDFVFYLSCREINTIPGDISLVELLSRTCRIQSSDDLVSILKDPENQRKLLFLVDGFDELRWTLEEKSEVCLDISMETHHEIILQTLLRRHLLPQSSLIITTRSLAIQKLNKFIDDYRIVEIQGFTREDREEYVHKFYGNKEDADKVLSIIKDNEVLYTMCAVPITCWIVCTITKQEIRKDLALTRCNTMTSIYLLYLEVLLIHHSKKEQSVDRKQTCLKKLCALANQGVLNQQILFERKDLERHGLTMSEMESLFLNENIFHWGARTQTCYSFIHLSVQEFLAALYYGLDDGWFGYFKRTFLPEICKGGTQIHFNLDYPHLALAVQFLFGLLNENQVKTFSEITGIPISLRARSAMKKWAMEDMSETFHTQTIFCLYETQDEDFIKSAMSGWSSLSLFGSRTGPSWMNSNYSKQLNYCLTTLKRESFQYLRFRLLTVGPECQKILSSLLHRCKEVRFETCIISSKDCQAENEEESTSEDKIKSSDLSFLMNPESKIQELQLNSCGLTSSCCDDLSSILITNQSLTTLDISQNDLQDSGIKLLCEGFRHLGCTLQRLRLGNCGATSSCCVDLHSILITNQSLTSLDLSCNNLEDSGIKLLCEGLRHPGCTLQWLMLDGCGLTSSCCEDLSSILITNQSLISIGLSHNNLQDCGIKLLCKGLKHPGCTLKELCFIDCKVTLSCCDDLCTLITTNHSLTRLQLTLDDEKMSDSEVKNCSEVLRNYGFYLGRREGGWINITYKRK